jgi:hypothetical protein
LERDWTGRAGRNWKTGRVCFDMYVHVYMHMFGLREPMVLSALNLLGPGPTNMWNISGLPAHRRPPKVPMFYLFSVLSYYS